MKKIYFLLFTLLLLLNLSCSKDEAPDNEEKLSLTGEWQLEEFNYQGTTTVRNGDMVDESSYTGTAKDIDIYMVFNEQPDKTWESGGEYTVELVATVNGEVQTSEETYSDILSSGSYSVEESILKLGYNQTEGALAITEAVISKLTETELVLEFEFSETSEVSGYEVELLVKGTQRFSR